MKVGWAWDFLSRNGGALVGLITLLAYVQFFAVGLYFLLRNHLNVLDRITIDLEYFGKDDEIKAHLLNLLKRSKFEIDADVIQFGQVGKQSGSHKLALATLQKKKQPNLVLTKEDIIGEFRRPRRKWKARKEKGSRKEGR